MSEPLHVLKASALAPAQFEEVGSLAFVPAPSGARMSDTNSSELVVKLADHGLAKENLLRDLAEPDMVVCDFDRQQADISGLPRSASRTARLSLGEHACPALTASLGGIVVTADRAWLNLNLDVAVQVVRWFSRR